VRVEREGHVFIFVARRATSEDCARDPRLAWGDWRMVPELVELYRTRKGLERHLATVRGGAAFDRLAPCFERLRDQARSTNSGHPAWSECEVVAGRPPERNIFTCRHEPRGFLVQADGRGGWAVLRARTRGGRWERVAEGYESYVEACMVADRMVGNYEAEEACDG
jgi:hypothetical protein